MSSRPQPPTDAEQTERAVDSIRWRRRSYGLSVDGIEEEVERTAAGLAKRDEPAFHPSPARKPS